jgi:PIN domain nuclease of toxin-antitoxin system
LTTYLLDTHVLLWAAQDSPSLSPAARGILNNPANDILISAASIWEVVIKSGLGRPDFSADPERLRERALRAGLGELPIRALHVLEISALPSIYSDPFDRILLAQARSEGLTLLTHDRKLLEYGAPALEV